MNLGRAGPHWAAVLAFDDGALERMARAPAPPGGDPLVAALAAAWLALMRGHAAAIEPDMAGLFARAAATRDPRRVIEATALRAMIALSGDKLAAAVAFARRASLMARTEALPEAEMLANLALARMRRHTGKPHLAVANPGGAGAAGARCAGGLAALGTPAVRRRRARASRGCAARGRQRRRQQRRGRRRVRQTPAAGRARREASGLRSRGGVAVGQHARVLGRARRGVGAAGPAYPNRRPPIPLVPFITGASAELKYGLHRAAVFSGGEEPGTTVFVVARPGARGRRILRDGLGLFGSCQMLSDEHDARRAHGRTDAALAALALAGPQGAPEEDSFRSVYGFPYAHAPHRGVLDVLLHRVRKRIGSAGVIARSDGRLALALSAPIAVADPLCSPPAAARILSALARQPQATADVIAAQLGIGVRAAQLALQQLVSDGACAMRRRARHVEYQLRDTTFSEPTSSDVLGGK